MRRFTHGADLVVVWEVQSSMQERVNVRVDSHLRSVVKAFSWRIIATLTTAAIAYWVTGRIDTAVLIGGIEFFLKFIIYYGHERAWHRIR